MDAEAFHVEFGGAPEHKWESPETPRYGSTIVLVALRYDIAMLGWDVYILFLSPSYVQNLRRIT